MSLQQKFQQIVSALQSELEEYGALLHLFDRQKQYMDREDPLGVLHINVEVAEQIAKLKRCRQQRDKLVSHMALAIGKPKNTVLSLMIQSFKTEHQSLMVALIDEIDDLACRTRRHLRESGMLLAQCVDFASQLHNTNKSISGANWGLDKIEDIYDYKQFTSAVPQMRITGRTRTGQTSMEVEQHCLASY